MEILYNPWGINGYVSDQGHQVYGGTFTCNDAFVAQNFIDDDWAYPGA
jgi:hypothetical protein